MKLLNAIILIVYLHTCYAGFYKASVVDYLEEPNYDRPKVVLAANSQRINDLIYKTTEQGSKIVVFPEAIFVTSKVYKLSKDQLKRFSVRIPQPSENVTLCNNSMYSKDLQKISCAAQRNEIYVVINCLEVSEDHYYNTNVVFDTAGKIVWRQRKSVNYINSVLDVNSNDEFLFETTFGVNFAMLISYEIFNYTKIKMAIDGNISNFIISSAWSLRNGTIVKSLTYYRSMAQKYNINLLLSELHLPNFNGPGSGIFAGGKAEVTENATHSNNIGTTILSAIVENPTILTPESQTLKYIIDAEDLERLLDRFEQKNIKENSDECTIYQHAESMKFYSDEKLIPFTDEPGNPTKLNVFLCAIVIQVENNSAVEFVIESSNENAFPFTNVTGATYMQDNNRQSIRVKPTKTFAIGFYLISIPSLMRKERKIATPTMGENNNNYTEKLECNNVVMLVILGFLIFNIFLTLNF